MCRLVDEGFNELDSSQCLGAKREILIFKMGIKKAMGKQIYFVVLKII